jgi:HEAT repeat protein
MRFWAAVALTAQGEDARAAIPGLRVALSDELPSVRLQAAEALCKLGESKRALPVIIADLRHDSPLVRLQAAMALAAVGKAARPAAAEIKEVIGLQGEGDYPMFIRWALERALRNIEP